MLYEGLTWLLPSSSPPPSRTSSGKRKSSLIFVRPSHGLDYQFKRDMS